MKEIFKKNLFFFNESKMSPETEEHFILHLISIYYIIAI